jgi:tRNA (cytosine38-C5)-methyltransferase
VAQFHLQPTQVGVPNDRPRYYCVAVRNHDNTTGSTGNSGTSSCPITSDGGVVPLPVEADVTSTGNWMSKYFSNPRCTENSHFMIHSSLIELGVIPGDKVQPDDLPALSVYLDSTINESNHKDLCVSETLLTRPAAWCLDIVTPSSHRSSCFTSAYGKYAKGTGSVLLQTKKTDDTHHLSSNFCGGDKYKLIPPEERQYDPNWASTLTEDGCYLRYFSGNELTRLFGFQDSFTFPTHTTMRQQWKLIGNSLNVTLTTTVVELALRTYFNKPQRKSSR